MLPYRNLHLQTSFGITTVAITKFASAKELRAMRFQVKVVLITGGGGGIGKAAARRFLEEGASVVLNSRRQAVLDRAKDELAAYDDRIGLVAADASKRPAAQELVDRTVDTFGRVDVVVNSTGIFRVVPFFDQTGGKREGGGAGGVWRVSH